MRYKTRHGGEGRWAALSCLAWEQGIAGAPLTVSEASRFFSFLKTAQRTPSNLPNPGAVGDPA